MAIIGTVGEFNIERKDDFESYEERMTMFFEANGITEVGKQKAVFLSMCGLPLYQLMKSLTAPAKPTEKTYAELVTLVKTYLNP